MSPGLRVVKRKEKKARQQTAWGEPGEWVVETKADGKAGRDSQGANKRRTEAGVKLNFPDQGRKNCLCHSGRIDAEGQTDPGNIKESFIPRPSFPRPAVYCYHHPN
ncbi:hypothetical protein RUM43_012763 [Polyplax serrata]|uniref:Uncharacterized protein n=1 Tax=Polyplax serrata TaxID=468196 RepID=A0AAN8PI70_POLSC